MPTKSMKESNGLSKKKNLTQNKDKNVGLGEGDSLPSQKGSEVGDPINLTALRIQDDAKNNDEVNISQQSFLKVEENPDDIKHYLFDEGS